MSIPSDSYNPMKRANLLPRSIPSFDATDEDFVAFLRTTDYGRNIIDAFPHYDSNTTGKKGYMHIKAKDLILSFSKLPISHRSAVVQELIANCAVVEGTTLANFPEVKPFTLPPFVKFENPLRASRLPPFEADKIYVFTDASVYKKGPKGNQVTYAGWAYVIVYRGVVIDEGIAMPTGPFMEDASASHCAELEGLCMGLQAAYICLMSMSEKDRGMVTGICVLNDSDSAINHARGASAVTGLSEQSQQTVWKISNVMNALHDHNIATHFRQIDRYLNAAADALAKQACYKHEDPNKMIQLEDYLRERERLQRRDVRVAFKVEKTKD